MSFFHVLTILSFSFILISANVYLISPMGSNNRADEANRGRNNANRLFDSDNNNRGGFNMGNVYYYTGSMVSVQWTAENGCNNPNSDCLIVLQYMCDDGIRDGTNAETIPANSESDLNPKYGRHESYLSYLECSYRSRNTGLFIANQYLDRQTAKHTRQNPTGQRYGYECPEERDYYPYWGPTKWRDIAVLTNNPKLCKSYQDQSENVKSRWYCKLSPELLTEKIKKVNFVEQPVIATTKENCLKICSESKTTNTSCAEWVESPSHGIPAPDCRETEFSRDNHLGNVDGGFLASYNWTVPTNVIHERCVMRIRYNVSTTDYQAYPSTGDSLTPVTTSTHNYNPALQTSAGRDTQATKNPAQLDVWSKYGLTRGDVNASFTNTDTNSRGYVFKTNPSVDIFGSLLTGTTKVKLQLGIRTDYVSRVFQDRTHRFAIRTAPSDLKGATIHNLQVSGKRGNIVQVYPANEYNFSPQRLMVKNGDYVHFQWTGSNTNPDNNAGQGKAGTDRSNVVLLRKPLYSEGRGISDPPTYGAYGRSYPDLIHNTTFLGFSVADRIRLATTSYGPAQNGQFGGNMDELNDAGTYFDLGPRQATQNGIYHYLCTRNNNFSNRDQKGTIVVSNSAITNNLMGWNGGSVRASNGDSIVASQGAFSSLVSVSVTTYPSDTSSSLSGSPASSYLVVTPLELPLSSGSTIQINVAYNDNPLVKAKLYRADDFHGSFDTVSGASYSGGTASADVSRGGVYVVKTETDGGKVAGIVIGVVAFVAIVIGVLVWYFRRPSNVKKEPETKNLKK